MYRLVKPIFFTMDPETAHHQVTGGLRKFNRIWGAKPLLKSIYTVDDPRLKKEVFGLTFKNPVGLAAGFDKNAEYIEDMAGLGICYIEIGTVTPRHQQCNDKARMFRLLADEGLINSMRFNNQGANVADGRLKKLKERNDIIIGGNIRKNKTTPNEE